MTKAEITEFVYRVHGGLSKQEARQFVDKVFDILKERLLKGDSVLLTSFGTFKSVNKIERIGRNPQTGEKIKISPHKVITFKASKDFLKRLDTKD